MRSAVADRPALDRDGGTGGGFETEGLGGSGTGARAQGLGVGRGGGSGGAGAGGGGDCWAAVARELATRAHTDVPRALRQRGLTGEVVLVFSLSGDGVARHVRIDKSSGSPLLDEAAVALLVRPLGVGCAGEGRWPVRWRPRAATP